MSLKLGFEISFHEPNLCFHVILFPFSCKHEQKEVRLSRKKKISLKFFLLDVFISSKLNFVDIIIIQFFVCNSIKVL